jgi:carbamoyltransferase
MSSIYILGVSCFYHDSAACLIKDGVILAAAQEERFTRIKNDASFPILAISFCLERANISEDQITEIVFYERTALVIERYLNELALQERQVAKKMYQNLMKVWNSEIGRAHV